MGWLLHEVDLVGGRGGELAAGCWGERLLLGGEGLLGRGLVEGLLRRRRLERLLLL